MPVSSTTLASDQGKYIADELIARSTLLHKLPQYCEKVTLPQGMGQTANFIKYNRTDVPLTSLTEGVTPAETPFTISNQSILVNEWGLYIVLTGVSLLTTKHPVLQEGLTLLADAIARAQDYGIAEVLNAGTNVQYWDGTRANRGAITSSDIFNGNVATKIRVDLNDSGAKPRDGDLYVSVIGPQIEGDISNYAAATGGVSFGTAHQLSGTEKLENGVVGNWLGHKWVRSNFVPKFIRIATFGAPVANAAGGTLTGTIYFKTTRKDTQRGFEEAMAVEGNNAMSTNTRLVFTAPSTSGYVYNIYVGSTTGDANLFLYASNVAPSSVTNVDSVPTTGSNPPATPAASVTVHPIYTFAARAVDWVELSGSSMQGSITPAGPSDSDPLSQRRKMGSKYMAKSGIRTANFFKRTELTSTF